MRKGIAGESLRGGSRPGGFGGLLSPEQAERLRQKEPATGIASSIPVLVPDGLKPLLQRERATRS